ncbi:MAG: hypothetical protein EPN37_07220 [Chitinophagaceae bacterium]|nr:MAG: hypothetical protein EPN37_07220 [Chitinophagaceae bacterium]
MAETFFFHGVGFNMDWIASLELSEFVGHPSNNHLWPDIDQSEKRDRLKAVHKACTHGNNDSGNGDAVENAESAEGSTGDHQTDEGGYSDIAAATNVRGKGRRERGDNAAIRPENDIHKDPETEATSTGG